MSRSDEREWIVDHMLIGAVEAISKIGAERGLGPVSETLRAIMRNDLCRVVDSMSQRAIDKLRLSRPEDIAKATRDNGLKALAGERPS